MATDTVVHEAPAWREKANFIIAASITDTSPQPRWRWEQLWARQTGEESFEVCCIPFFVYDLALGDEVGTETYEGKKYVVRRLLKQSGHYTFRVWLHQPSARGELTAALDGLGCLWEQRWPASKMLAVDAADASAAQAVANYLQGEETKGRLVYETGRTA